MADRVLYQTDDDLSQANLKNTQYRQNAVDYVERGLSLSNYDSGAPSVDLSSGHCVIDAGSGAAYDVFPDARTNISLTDSATNDIFVSIDPTVDDSISVSALTSGTPSDPSVKVGEVDTSADTTTDVNRDPSGSFGGVDTTGDITDTANSKTVYDESATQVGDGSTSADHSSVSTDEGTIDNGKELPGIPSTSSDPGLSFNTWRNPSSDRAVLVVTRLMAETDGTSISEVIIEIDNSGGTNFDYQLNGAYIESSAGSGTETRETSTFILPPGASYKFNNSSDPNNNNSIYNHQEYVL